MTASALGLRLMLASLFLSAGAAKLARRHEFERAVASYELLPAGLVRPVAFAIGPAELAGGLLLALGLATPATAALVATLLVILTAAVAVNLVRGRAIDCGCFGVVAERRIGWSTVLRNVMLAGSAIAVAAVAPAPFSLDRVLAGRETGISWDEGVALLFCSTAAVFGFAVARQALALRRLTAVYAPAREGEA
jgi:uncharacterized membrane protein YphA (DoxX/SURF4 family)